MAKQLSSLSKQLRNLLASHQDQLPPKAIMAALGLELMEAAARVKGIEMTDEQHEQAASMMAGSCLGIITLLSQQVPESGLGEAEIRTAKTPEEFEELMRDCLVETFNINCSTHGVKPMVFDDPANAAMLKSVATAASKASAAAFACHQPNGQCHNYMVALHDAAWKAMHKVRVAHDRSN